MECVLSLSPATHKAYDEVGAGFGAGWRICSGRADGASWRMRDGQRLSVSPVAAERRLELTQCDALSIPATVLPVHTSVSKLSTVPSWSVLECSVCSEREAEGRSAGDSEPDLLQARAAKGETACKKCTGIFGRETSHTCVLIEVCNSLPVSITWDAGFI